MWLNLLGRYSSDLLGIVFMAMIPYVFWVFGRVSGFAMCGQVRRIPRWLRWIPESNPEVKKALERGYVPRNNQGLILSVAAVGLPLPVLSLLRSIVPLAHRIVVLLVTAVLFSLAVAFFEWLVRPRADKEQ
jgi:hypothetical protein